MKHSIAELRKLREAAPSFQELEQAIEVIERGPVFSVRYDYQRVVRRAKQYHKAVYAVLPELLEVWERYEKAKRYVKVLEFGKGLLRHEKDCSCLYCVDDLDDKLKEFVDNWERELELDRKRGEG